MAQHPTYPILYSFRRCPYAMRARLAIIASDIQCELREVVLRNKPAELLGASPKGTVPVLITPENVVIEQSLEIMHWALQQNDPGQWLKPEIDTSQAMEVLIRECDTSFKANLDRYKYPQRYAHEGVVDGEYYRTQGALFLATLEVRLVMSDYLFGTKPALADMAIFPFIRQFANTDKAWFEGQPWPRLHAWLSQLINSEIYAMAMTLYAPWPGEAAESTLSIFPPPKVNA